MPLIVDRVDSPLLAQVKERLRRDPHERSIIVIPDAAEASADPDGDPRVVTCSRLLDALAVPEPI